MAHAGYKGALYSTGTSTAFTGEACTLVSGTTYRINDTAKRIWDPDVALTFYDAATPVSGTASRLDGTVTLDVAPGGAVTVDGSYLPIVEIACAFEWSVEIARTILDKSCFSKTEQAKRKFLGLKTFNLSLSELEFSTLFGTDTLDEILHGKKATGTITAVAKASLLDTETFTINDGVNPAVVFEIDIDGGGVTAGNVQVDVTAATDADSVAVIIAAAINTASATAGVNFNGSATSAAAVVTVSVNYGAQGNNTITETVANAGFLVTGLTGGTDEIVKVLQVDVGGTTPDWRIRAFVIMSTKERTSNVDGRAEESLSFELAGAANETYSETRLIA